MTSAVFAAAAVHFRPRSGYRRLWKRRRLKPHRAALPLHLPFIAPAALGFLSGAALVLTRSKFTHHTAEPIAPEAAVDEVGEWLLVTAPTPFNRFVLLRCPSISFSDDDAADEGFLREGRRFVNLCGGKISPAARKEPTVNYQRVCVGVEDGGVVSLDWPANLELGEERGLDTTVLLVAGTPEGSMDGNVAALVSDAVKCGLFPVVMNPRGCAGSPLTTARIFSAADSDDVATAVKFINKLRPWSTMMAVGWGYGANMLTKYLAEIGENTPLTAAVCIDSPFDLEEASRLNPHHISLDKKLMAGLVDILQANKELFQGKTKGFSVTQGLSATSVREFDEAISMVSNGFQTIEEFYSKTSTRGLIGNLKVPVLFIQSDDGTVPLFSVPRETIAENTFTSLLLCTHKPSNATEIGNSAILWCQQFVIEWLSAVELALLKGRHPLLKDVDVTVNPSKGLTFLEDQRLENRLSIGDGYDMDNAIKLTSGNYRNKFLTESEDWTKSNYSNRYSVNGISNIVIASKIASKVEESTHQNSILNTNLAGGGEENPSETEGGEGMQTAEVAINMLDATLPGTLTDDQKKKILTAVTQGETFLKALQGAVPEDVRGKLTAAVTEIVQTRGLNLNLEGLKGIKLPNIPSDVKLKIQERLTRNAKNGTVGSFGESNKGEDVKENPHRNESYSESVSQEDEIKMSPESDLHPPFTSLNAANSDKSEGGISVDRDIPLSSSNDAGEYVQTYDSGEACRGSSNSENESAEQRMDENANQEAVMQEKIKQTSSDPGEHADSQSTKETNVILKDEEKQLKSQNERGGLPLNTEGDVMSSPSLQSREQEDVLKRKIKNDSGGDNKQGTGQGIVGKSEEISPKNPSSAGPPISVSQALDALTVFDDSTQMAVNSVFGVIENMIDQLEKDNGHNNNGKLETDVKSSVGDVIEKGNNAVSQQTLSEKNAFKESSASSRWDEVNEVSTKSFSGNHNSTSDFSFAILNGRNSCYNQSNRNGKTSSQAMTSSSFLSENAKLSLVDKFPIHIIVSSYSGVPDNVYGKSPTSNDSKETTLDLDSTTDLFFEYFPEEGQYRLLDQLGPNIVSIPDNGTGSISNANSSLVEENGGENIIEPSYVILDDDYGNAQNELEMVEPNSGHGKNLKLSTLFEGDAMPSVATIQLETLKVEVCRRIGTSDISSMLFSDMEQVATAVALSLSKIDAVDFLLEKQSTGNGKDVKFGLENFVEIITSAVNGTTHLRKIIPVGIIVGSILASLREHVSEFHTKRDEKLQNRSKYDPPDSLDKTKTSNIVKTPKTSTIVRTPVSGENNETKSMANEKVMVGAAAAALGASALLAHKKAISFSEDSRSPCSSTFTDDDNESMEENNAGSDGMQNNIVSSLAEKALSVAAPVVPTNSDGEVDQEKLVNMLADLGQKGGMLKFIGKIALLWGGIRGAMSLTDRLISFLHIAERPLYQRVLGFSGMVIVLWSPVVVPLLPTLVQNWIAHRSFGIAHYACVAGLYASVVILVALWGKRTRGYERPLQQYGLDLACSSTIFYYLKGWIGGVALVMAMHLVNLAFGFACFHWPSGGFLPMHGTFSWVKYCGNITFLSLRETSSATFVVAVEELLFRSWLPDEITLDLGYNLAIVISSFAFSLTHRSLFAIPGLFLLSVALFGVKERNQGKIAIPIGLRSGAIAATSVMKVGGFLLYLPTAPQWVTGTYPWQPYQGAIGIAFCAFMALLFHPPGFFRDKK